VIPQFATLADAVQATFPPDECRVLAIKEHGDAGYALFDTRPTGDPYLYEVHYLRQDGLWSEGGSSNGSGWHRFHLDTDRGMETVWGEAPPGADRARFEFAREMREEAVVHGVYIAVWWDVACPEVHAEPTEFGVNGKWVRAPTRAELFEAQREAWRRAREAGGAA